ncbi:MAG TPA: DUF192 domain-containing protein [Eoetvoesiella sp.]
MFNFFKFTGLSSPVFLGGSCTLSILAFSLALQTTAAQTQLLPTTELSIGTYPVHAEVAATNEARSYGLMNRTALPADHGMLFVFEQPGVQCFWMKNTPLALSIAFINDKGTILNIADMQALSEDVHCPAGAVLYALEMEQGWFADKKIKAGEIVAGLPLP